MPDPNAVPVALPPLVTQIMSGLARHGLTLLAGALEAHGYLQSSQAQSFTEEGIGLVILLAGVGWSYWQKTHARSLLTAALDTPVPTVATTDQSATKIVDLAQSPHPEA